uniref:Transmembrane protein 270 n=1 Tax=Oryctolagus cuniculus TaxID=9986 RepID=A0A5F9DJX5_RABIT
MVTWSPPCAICDVTLPILAGAGWGGGGRPDMEVVPPVRPSLLGVLLQVLRLSVLLVQNRAHLYKFLLIKITLFNDWVSGLAQEARGDSGRQPRPPPGVLACPLGRVLMWVPMWLLLWGPRLAWAAVLGCVRTLGLSLQRLGLSVATWGDLLLSCLHSLMLVALLLVLLTWRLFQKAHRCSLGWLPGQVRGLGLGLGVWAQAAEGRLRALCVAQGWGRGRGQQPGSAVVGAPGCVWGGLCLPQVLLGNHAVLELLRRLSWWVESTTALASWHLAYLVTWTTCLASHLLQAAFEHTAQLARAQETQPLQAPEPLSEPPLPKASTPEAGPVLPEPGPPGE